MKPCLDRSDSRRPVLSHFLSASSSVDAVMAAPASPGNARWNSGRVPKLSYRKPLSAEDAANLPIRTSLNVKPAPEITPVETFAPPVILPPKSQPAPSFQTQAPKKKSSLFGGLFAREPTLVALAEVEAELRVKHGAATAERVPHVSSRRMPAHVPRVNSKWDGLPEAVKTRGHEQRSSHRMSQYETYGAANTSPSDLTDQAQNMRRNSELDGNVELWRGRTAEVAGADFSYSSASSIISQRSANRVTTSDSFTAPDAASYTSYPKAQASSKPVRPLDSTTSAHTSSDSSSGFSRSHVGTGEQPFLVPDHSRSPNTTPRETSPVTPGHNPEMLGLRIHAVPELDAMQASQSVPSMARSRHKPIDAFLAGEAQPFGIVEQEDNLDHARQRRGHHKASPSQSTEVHHTKVQVRRMPGSQQVSRQNATPWETQEPPPVTSGPGFQEKAQRRRSKGMGLFK